MRRFLTAIVLIVAVAACQRTKYGSRSEGPPPPPSVDSASFRVGGVEGGVAVAQAPTRAEAQRRIIRTANLSMVVGDTTKVIERATSAAESAGGYVSNSRIWREGQLLRGTLSIRVPEAKLSETLTAIRKLAVRVESESIGTEEVTQEYIDLESQLRNLEATEIELRELMRTIRERSRKASEVLEMHQQLMSIRAQIEQIKGRMRYLEQMSAFASLNVELIPDAIAKPVVKPGWQPVVVAKEAAGSLVKALQTVADAAIWVVVYFLPILLMLGIAILVLRRVISLAWKTRRSASL